MLVIEIDSHKDTLVGCLIDTTHNAVEYRDIPNTTEDHNKLIAWARAGGMTQVTTEGSSNHSRPATQTLTTTDVAAIFTMSVTLKFTNTHHCGCGCCRSTPTNDSSSPPRAANQC